VSPVQSPAPSQRQFPPCPSRFIFLPLVLPRRLSCSWTMRRHSSRPHLLLSPSRTPLWLLLYPLRPPPAPHHCFLPLTGLWRHLLSLDPLPSQSSPPAMTSASPEPLTSAPLAAPVVPRPPALAVSAGPSYSLVVANCPASASPSSSPPRASRP
jgi:hypothetical protein